MTRNKLRVKINEIKTKMQNNEIKSWFFEKIYNIDKPLCKLTKRQSKNIHMNKIRDERGY